MKTTMHAVNPQGLAHPQFSQSWLLTPFVDTIGLCSLAQRGTFEHVNGLSTRLQRWWIKHPTTQRLTGQSVFTRILSNTIDLSGACVPNSGLDGGAKNALNPQSVPVHSLLCALLSTCVLNSQENKLMIYTFLIAGGCQKLSDLKRIRTITVTAQTEAKARKQLLGLPLVFISQSPVMEVAA